eukprot:TRINITY_DN62938_c0_g1_i1.p1 TRINITY_DN62938_c0_g1~~TRINITY_DN62938_c0_g1_i1.p1  ORF type:complete len:255 (-),score=27.31 TRINITY_DN62938_c0_g1_i1:195-959(-)
MGANCSECIEPATLCSEAEHKGTAGVVSTLPALSSLETGRQVLLAATPIGARVPGLQAYHTSVVIGCTEYSFGPAGVAALRLHDYEVVETGSAAKSDTKTTGICGISLFATGGKVRKGGGSHRFVNGPAELSLMGFTTHTGSEMVRTLKPFFRRGTYDMLRKNCNAFSHCALAFLFNTGLDPAYNGLEKLGMAVEEFSGIVKLLSRGDYVPNPRAEGFSLEEVEREIAASVTAQKSLPKKSVCTSSPGLKTLWL